ncbi:MAG: universal stress protein [Solirubrobacteraceae bacterium]
MPGTPSDTELGETDHRSARITHIAAGVDGYSEGRDAATLASMIARAAGAELMMVAVHPDPMVVLPAEIGWTGMRKEAQRVLRETRDAVAPDARILVETDWSVPRALERVAQREHRDLIVVGSSRQGPEGRVRIGSRTRQLLSHSRCALAVAPRGLSEQPARRLTRIGVGYEGAPESEAALALAGALAVSAGATLWVRAVIDDRVPMVGWQSAVREQMLAMWDELLAPNIAALLERTQSASEATGAELAEVDVRRGRPADALMELCEQVDLLVIGSRRWGGAARVLLGGTGEALMHDATAAVLVVPRPEV